MTTQIPNEVSRRDLSSFKSSCTNGQIFTNHRQRWCVQVIVWTIQPFTVATGAKAGVFNNLNILPQCFAQILPKASFPGRCLVALLVQSGTVHRGFRTSTSPSSLCDAQCIAPPPGFPNMGCFPQPGIPLHFLFRMSTSVASLCRAHRIAFFLADCFSPSRSAPSAK